MFQLVDRLPPLHSPAGRIALAALILSAAASILALGFLAASVYPARFNYVSPETQLLTYALGLIEEERTSRSPGFEGQRPLALTTLKETLAEQYAVCTTHNRRINKRRESRRAVAGLAIIVSVVLTLLVVAATVAHYLDDPSNKVRSHGETQGTAPGRTASASSPPGLATP